MAEAKVDETSLGKRVRAAMQAGELPRRLPDRLLGGASTGRGCVFCGESTLGGMELELLFADTDGESGRTFCAHPRCLWIFEREIRISSDRQRELSNPAANAAD